MTNILQFRVLTDNEEAKKAWQELSPDAVIDDNWDFRQIFFTHANCSLHFIAGYDNGVLVGLLPLQWNTRQGLIPAQFPKGHDFLEFFGGDDTDDNYIYLKPGYEQYENEFFAQIDKLAFLAPLASKYGERSDVALYEHKYTLDLTPYTGYENFLDKTYTSDTKGKIKRGLKKLFAQYSIEILENNYEDVELLFRLNVERFGEASSFNHPSRQAIFRDLVKQFPVQMITLVLNGKKEAVSFAIHWKHTYVSMNMGYNPTINNLGKYLLFLQMEKAIKLGCTIYDGGKGDSGWKEQFKFAKNPQYKLPIQK